MQSCFSRLDKSAGTVGRIVNLVVALLLISAWQRVAAAQQPSFVTNGIILYIPFNGVANDLSGNGFLTSAVDLQYGTDRFGNRHQSAEFNGQTSYLRTEGLSAQGLNQSRTISLWVFNQTENNRYVFLAGQEGDNTLAEGGRIGLNSRGWPNYYSQWGGAEENLPLTQGFWTHIVGVTSRGFTSLYRNGRLVSRNTDVWTRAGALGQPIFLGRSPFPVTGFGYLPFQGLMDDLRIYNRAFSDAEVKELYDYESLPPDNAFVVNGLVAYYPFNGNSKDFSGNAFDGNQTSIVAAADRWGNRIGSIEFNGTNSFIEVPSFISQTFSNQITISFWFMDDVSRSPDGFEHYILSTVSSSPIPYRGFDVALVNAANEGAPAGLWFREFGGVNDGTGLSIVGSNLIRSNAWHHVVYVLNGTSSSICFDGDIVPPWRPSMPFPLSYQPMPLLIGKGSWRAWRDGLYKGRLDDLRIYNRSLSDAEMKALYDYESIPQPQEPRSATAIAQVVNGFVVGAIVIDGGSGYTNSPAVTVTGGGGSGARFQASILDGVVTGLVVVNPGTGYINPPTITIASPPTPPRKANGSSSVVNGFVVGISLNDGGAGYDAPPVVVLTGGGGTGATAVATVVNGVVTGIAITNPGSGYTSAPSVLIASPPFAPRLGVAISSRLEAAISKVRVTLKVVLGRRYQLESSTDMSTWSPSGSPFVAQDELLTQEFDVDVTGRFFRINQVP